MIWKGFRALRENWLLFGRGLLNMNGRKWIFISSLLSSRILTVVRSLAFLGWEARGPWVMTDTMPSSDSVVIATFQHHRASTATTGHPRLQQAGQPHLKEEKTPNLFCHRHLSSGQLCCLNVLICAQVMFDSIGQTTDPGEWVTPGNMRPQKGLRSQGHPKMRQLCLIQGPACWVFLWSFLKNTASAKDSFQGPSCQTEQPTEALGLGLVIVLIWRELH